MNPGPISQFIQHHYRHFNAAALVDAAKGYEAHLTEGGKMIVTRWRGMSTAELGVSLAKWFSGVKGGYHLLHRVPISKKIWWTWSRTVITYASHIRDLTPQGRVGFAWKKGLNQVTDTCIPEEEFRRLQNISIGYGKQMIKAERFFHMNLCTVCCAAAYSKQYIMRLIQAFWMIAAAEKNPRSSASG